MKIKSTSLTTSPVIFDITVLSTFSLVHALYVIRQTYAGKAFVGKVIQREIQTEITRSSETSPREQTKLQEINQAIDEGWLKTPNYEAEPSDEVRELQFSLEYSKRFSAGESEAMAIASNRNWVFASDDGTTRSFAIDREIRGGC